MSHRLPTERSFGVSVGLACAAAGAWAAWRAHPTVAWLFVTIGVVLLVAGLTAPAVLRIPNRLWWRFAQALGWINTRVLLIVFFVVVITPLGVLMRTFGQNPLRPSHRGTSWSSYAARRRSSQHYEHLF